MIEEKLITIIVPIYNVERFLNQCLDSLVLQTNQNFVVILVNDGSNDKSGDIAQSYAIKYPHLFKYYQQENKGLGAARNKGLQFINTKYTMFLDSDDFLASKCIDNIINGLNSFDSPPDIALLMPTIYDMNTNSYAPWLDESKVRKIFENSGMLNCSDSPELLSTEASVCRSVWLTGFLKQNRLAFPEGTRWEDVPFHFFAFRYAKKIVFLDFAGAYYYRINSGSQITSQSGSSRLEISDVFLSVIKVANKENWEESYFYHIFCYLQNFTTWSYRLIEVKYLKNFVSKLHFTYAKIPFNLCIKYLKDSSVLRQRRYFALIMRMPVFYRMLKHKRFLLKLLHICRRIKHGLHR